MITRCCKLFRPTHVSDVEVMEQIVEQIKSRCAGCDDTDRVVTAEIVSDAIQHLKSNDEL